MRNYTIEKCEPAATIIEALGGLEVVARAAAVNIVTARRWRFPKDNGGTDGHIPRKHHRALIKLARRRGIDLPLGAFVDASLVPRASVSGAAA